MIVWRMGEESIRLHQGRQNSSRRTLDAERFFTPEAQGWLIMKPLIPTLVNNFKEYLWEKLY
jgi:hypothetical protein